VDFYKTHLSAKLIKRCDFTGNLVLSQFGVITFPVRGTRAIFFWVGCTRHCSVALGSWSPAQIMSGPKTADEMFFICGDHYFFVFLKELLTRPEIDERQKGFDNKAM
jgi:hypothetical protein